jgi:hypothetical protein
VFLYVHGSHLGAVDLRGHHGQLVAVSSQIGEADDVVHLVVMAEDQQPVAELGAAGGDALEQRLVVQIEVAGLGLRGRVGARSFEQRELHESTL